MNNLRFFKAIILLSLASSASASADPASNTRRIGAPELVTDGKQKLYCTFSLAGIRECFQDPSGKDPISPIPDWAKAQYEKDRAQRAQAQNKIKCDSHRGKPMPKFPESAFCQRSPDFRALKSKLAKEVTAHLEILNSPEVKKVDPALFESALRSLKNGSVQESAARRITHEADLKAQEELNKIPGLEAQTDKGAAFWKKVCDQKIAKEKEIALKLKEISGAGADSGKPEFHENIAAIYEKVRTSASEYSGFIEKGMQEWKSEMSRKEGQARRVVTGNSPAQTAALRERYSEELKQWRLDRYILKDFFQELLDEEHTYKMFGFDAHDMVRGANACSASMSTQ